MFCIVYQFMWHDVEVIIRLILDFHSFFYQKYLKYQHWRLVTCKQFDLKFRIIYLKNIKNKL